MKLKPMPIGYVKSTKTPTFHFAMVPDMIRPTGLYFHLSIYALIHQLVPELWPCGRVSAWHPGDQGSIPGPVRPKTVKKWDPMPPCLALSMKGWIGGSSLR